MPGRRVRQSLAGLVVATCLASSTQAQPLRLWPAPYKVLWGLEFTVCKPQKGAGGDQAVRTAKIHPDLCPVFEDKKLTSSFVDQFETELKTKIPNVIEELRDGLAAGVPTQDALQQTLVASLHLSRADMWTIDKGRSVDIFLPFTLTVNFTNAASGEVVFTQSETVIPQGTFTKADGIGEARSQLAVQLTKAITALVDKAAAGYKPYPIVAKVRGKVGDKSYVIDKGRLAGIRAGERIGADAKVEFADANYAIVRAGLFPLEVDGEISKSAAAPVAALARPSVFVVLADAPQDKSASYLRLLFEQRLGQGNALTVMPGNDSFTTIRKLMLEKSAAPSSDLTDRPLPEYLMRVQVYNLPATKLDTNLPNIRMHSYQAYATAEIVDRSGRVVFATFADNRIDDQVAAFGEDARHDTVISNALQQLADKVSTGFKPQQLRLPLKGNGASFSLNDPAGNVSDRAVGVVLRKKGGVSGIGGDVWTPVGNYRLDGSLSDGLILRQIGLGDIKLREGDVCSFDSGTSPVLSRQSYSQCASVPLPDLQVEPRLLVTLASNRFMSHFQAPVYLSGFGPILQNYMDDFSQERLQELTVLNRPDADRCFAPVVRVTSGADIEGKGGTVTPTATVATGFMLKAGETRLAASGTQLQLKGSTLPQTALPADRNVALVRDASSVVIQLADQWGKANKPPQ